MKKLKQFRKEPNKQVENTHAGPTQVSGISGIPFEATSLDIFRLTVEVDQVIERETKTGNPYYFLQCRDGEGMMLSIIVWDSQLSRLQKRLEEETKLELNLHPPKENYSAFTLA